MKTPIAIVTAIVVTILGFGAVASAANAYPPNGVSVAASPASGEPGYEVTVTVNCTVGERVTITLVASSDRVACIADRDLPSGSGSATGMVSAPSSAGEYSGSVNGSTSGSLGRFTVRGAAGGDACGYRRDTGRRVPGG